jgi:ribosomal protein L14E/L6E/L27E
MDIQIGRVVYSRAGRDKGEFLVVVGTIGDFLLVCNG